MRVRAPLWARERISSALRSIVCKLLTIFHLSTVVPAFSRPWAPPRYPTPKSPPSGRGLGGRSRRSPAGEVAALRRRFDSVFVQCQGRVIRAFHWGLQIMALSAGFIFFRLVCGHRFLNRMAINLLQHYFPQTQVNQFQDDTICQKNLFFDRIKHFPSRINF